MGVKKKHLKTDPGTKEGGFPRIGMQVTPQFMLVVGIGAYLGFEGGSGF